MSDGFATPAQPLEQFFASLRLDRESPIPLYFQVERAIEQEIVGGRWPRGCKIPSEPDIVRNLGVSRSVVRQALASLQRDGLIVRRHGHGSFVARNDRGTWLLDGVEGFLQDEVGRLGRAVRSTVLRAEVEVLPPWASDALDVPTGTSGVVLERLRYVDEKLTLYDVNYLPSNLAETVIALKGDPHGSLYEALSREHGLEVTGGRRIVDAVIAGAKLAKLLQVGPRSPLIVVEGIDVGGDQRPYDCYRTWLRPDRMKIEVEIVTSVGARRPRNAGPVTTG